jgi:hypothetical protein
MLGHGLNSLYTQVMAGDAGLYNAAGNYVSHHNGFVALLYDFGIVGAVLFFWAFSAEVRKMTGGGTVSYAYMCCFVSAMLLNTFEERLISMNTIFFTIILFFNLNMKALAAGAGTTVKAQPAKPFGITMVKHA